MQLIIRECPFCKSESAEVSFDADSPRCFMDCPDCGARAEAMAGDVIAALFGKSKDDVTQPATPVVADKPKGTKEKPKAVPQRQRLTRWSEDAPAIEKVE